MNNNLEQKINNAGFDRKNIDNDFGKNSIYDNFGRKII